MADAKQHSGVWILAEQAEGELSVVSFELLTRARVLADRLGETLTAILIGPALDDDALGELILRGADQVLTVESPDLATFINEPYAACLEQLIAEHDPAIILAAATTAGRTLMPYVAVRVHAGLTADCTELDIEEETGLLLQTRPAIGGNILATIKTPTHRPQMATVRPHSSRPAPRDPSRAGTGNIVRTVAPAMDGGVTVEAFIPDAQTQPLEDALRVVSVGRGLRKAENLPMVQALADVLGAAVGASREAVDRSWLGYPHQVGLSGKTVTPQLYVAAGISGAIQHLAGMQTAETIIAINRDVDAAIFRVADIGLVGDMFDILPALTEAIGKEGTS
jgi:electron transfer flavoprotein alpha subunit